MKKKSSQAEGWQVTEPPRVSREQAEEIVPALRTRLLKAQFELSDAKRPILIVLTGTDWWGRNELLNRLMEWMSPADLSVHALAPQRGPKNPGPSGFGEVGANRRPFLWTYWNALPARDQGAIFVNGWPGRAIAEQLRKPSDELWMRRLGQAAEFERNLRADGVLIVKVWLHLSARALGKRLKDKRKDREWSVCEEDGHLHRNYSETQDYATKLIQNATSDSPWLVVNSEHDRSRDIHVAEHIAQAMEQHLLKEAPVMSAAQMDRGHFFPDVLSEVDLSLQLDKEEYDRKLEKYQARLFDLTREAHYQGLSTALVFEGWDAAGKGGAIRRMTRAMDPRLYRCVRIGAPTDEELARQYLWRFWKQLPPRGSMRLFDRSWYGRVLVERVEGYASEPEWRLAYGEIEDFEGQLASEGFLVLKFWLHIDKETQLERFKAREDTPFKRHKITADDYRNREKWSAYEVAINEMVAFTHTEYAPWHLIPANDKRYARVEVIKAVCKALKRRLR